MFTLVVTFVLVVVFVVVVGAVLVDLLYGPEQPATPDASSQGAQWEPWRSWYRSFRVWLPDMAARARRGVPATGRRARRSTQRLVTAAVEHPTELVRTTRRSLTHRHRARAQRQAAHARHLAHIEHVEALMQVPNAPPPEPPPPPPLGTEEPVPVASDPVAAPAELSRDELDELVTTVTAAWAPPTSAPNPAPPPPPSAPAQPPSPPVPTPVPTSAAPPPAPPLPSPAPAPPPPSAPPAPPAIDPAATDQPSPAPVPPPRRSMLPGLVTPPGGVSEARPSAPLLDYGAGEVITGEHPIPVRGRRGPSTRRDTADGPARVTRPRRSSEPRAERGHRRPRAQGRAAEGTIVPLQMPLRTRVRALAVLSLVSVVVGVTAAGLLVTMIILITRALANV